MNWITDARKILNLMDGESGGPVDPYHYWSETPEQVRSLPFLYCSAGFLLLLLLTMMDFADPAGASVHEGVGARPVVATKRPRSVCIIHHF